MRSSSCLNNTSYIQYLFWLTKWMSNIKWGGGGSLFYIKRSKIN